MSYFQYITKTFETWERDNPTRDHWEFSEEMENWLIENVGVCSKNCYQEPLKNWAWSLTKINNHVKTGVYFERHTDAMIFLLKYNSHGVIKDS